MIKLLSLKSIISVLLLIIILQSCSNIYYVGETTVPTNIYAQQDTTMVVIYTVPIGNKILVKKKNKKYSYLIYQNYKGYIYQTKLNNYHKYNSVNDGELYGYSSNKPNTYKNKTYQSPTNSTGTVQVKGYHRKDGTYVRPHTRSAPKRR